MYTVLTSYACVLNLHLVFHANLGCLGSELCTLPSFLLSFFPSFWRWFRYIGFRVHIWCHSLSSSSTLSVVDVKPRMHMCSEHAPCFLCNFSFGLGCFVFRVLHPSFLLSSFLEEVLESTFCVIIDIEGRRYLSPECFKRSPD